MNWERASRDLWIIAAALIAVELYMRAAEFVVPMFWPEVKYPVGSAITALLITGAVLAFTAEITMFFYDRWTERDTE